MGSRGEDEQRGHSPFNDGFDGTPGERGFTEQEYCRRRHGPPQPEHILAPARDYFFSTGGCGSSGTPAMAAGSGGLRFNSFTRNATPSRRASAFRACGASYNFKIFGSLTTS